MDEYMPTLSEGQLLAAIDDFIRTRESRESILERIVGILSSNLRHYTWTGIYVLEEGVLKLGPFRGEPSPHVIIQVGQGICGAAVQEKKAVIVPDVNADPRYLACSLSTKSEIVVPIFKDNVVVAEIDVDSDQRDAFSDRDKKFLELVAARLGKIF